MAISYSEFKTTGANLLADIRTAILASGDWARPNAGARPDTYKATTTRGADMVVDLNAAALTSQRMTINYYTSYDGTTLGTPIPTTRYLFFKEAATGTLATNVFYVTVSVSKEHFFLMIEGPRGGETAADNAIYGSIRNYIFMGDMVPYYGSGDDPTAAIVAYATYLTSAGGAAPYTYKVNLSKSKAGTLFWNNASLMTLDYPASSSGPLVAQNRVGLDGSLFLAPFVVADDLEGVRGRLARFFYVGMNVGVTDPIQPVAQHGDFTTYDGIKYKILAVNRTGGTTNQQCWGPFGAINNNAGSLPTLQFSPLVAVPFS